MEGFESCLSCHSFVHVSPVLTESPAGRGRTGWLEDKKERVTGGPGAHYAPRKTHNAGTIPANPADPVGESNGQLDRRVSLGEQVRILHFDVRTVTVLDEVCTLESEYDASSRRLARKQEIKRHPWAVVMVCCLVMWCCWLVRDDHRPRACRETQRQQQSEGKAGNDATGAGGGVLLRKLSCLTSSHSCTSTCASTCTSTCSRSCTCTRTCTLHPAESSLPHSLTHALSLARFNSAHPRPKAYHGVLSYAQLAKAAPPSCRTRTAYQAIR